LEKYQKKYFFFLLDQKILVNPVKNNNKKLGHGINNFYFCGPLKGIQLPPIPYLKPTRRQGIVII
jgi:hypothetical protein